MQVKEKTNTFDKSLISTIWSIGRCGTAYSFFIHSFKYRVQIVNVQSILTVPVR